MSGGNGKGFLSVGAYLDRYAGRRFVIVGKGWTVFDYDNLALIDDPIIFINDAVQLERRAVLSPETFLFVQDPCQAHWLGESLRSTAVIPRAASVDSAGVPMLSLTDQFDRIHCAGAVCYEWDEGWRRHPAAVAGMSRQQLAECCKLFIGTGTIHAAIHFAWLCGASAITFIGCDGLNDSRDPAIAYDERLAIDSGGRPKAAFGRIRRQQDRLCEQLHLATEYIDTPYADPLIPRIGHFVWLGGDPPSWAIENVETFRRLHPDWQVILHRGIPSDMPADLRELVAGCGQYCMASDLIAYWLLSTTGGIYLDCDVIGLRSFERLRRFEAFAAPQSDGRINCAVMGSEPDGTAMEMVLAACKEIREPARRTAYGPDLLTALFKRDESRHISILPPHYFYLFRWGRGDANEAHRFAAADAIGRRAMLEARSDEWPDRVEPYAVHLWGVDGSSRRQVAETGRAAQCP